MQILHFILLFLSVARGQPIWMESGSLSGMYGLDNYLRLQHDSRNERWKIYRGA